MSLSINAAFDGGNIRVVATEGDRVDLEIVRDAGSDFYQWFHFRVAGARGRRLTFRILNAGGSAYPFGWPGYKVRASTDREGWRQVADTLRERFPKLAELMDGAREDVLAYMTFPREHWPQIASTNPLERLNGEIKRRADVVGIFPNDRAAVRLVGALMLEQNDEWDVSRRHMTLEGLAAFSDAPQVRLPAVAV